MMSTVNSHNVGWRGLALTVSVVLLGGSTAFCQGRGKGGKGGGAKIGAGPDSQQIQQMLQRIGQQMQQGDKELKDATEKAVAARQAWQKVDNENKKNLNELHQAKKFAEETARNSPEMKSAKERCDVFRKELAEIRKKVVGQLTENHAEYQAALKAHDAAIAEKQANSTGNDELRKTLAKNVAETERRLHTIEEVAMTDNPDAKKVNEKLKEAMSEMAAIVKKNHEAVENDSRTASAKVAFTRTRDELKLATAARDQAEGIANRIRAQMLALANEQASLQAQQQLLQRAQQGKKGKSGKK